jgi:GMP synthase (glutamine-hydrolysing)
MSDTRQEGADDSAKPQFAAGSGFASERLPVLIVLHQPHSNPGHVGQWFKARGHALDVRRPRYGDPLPETLEHHAGAVIFGGPMSANDPDDFVRIETEWIRVPLEEQKPFLGICLGAQMLARHLGSRVREHPEKVVEIGYHAVKGTAHAKQFGGWPDLVYQWHREGFEVPQGAVPLANGDGAFANQAFAYASAVAVQFHPEITYSMVNRWTGLNPQRLTQQGAHDRAAQLADHISHGPKVRKWLDSFLARWLTNRDMAEGPACALPSAFPVAAE